MLPISWFPPFTFFDDNDENLNNELYLKIAHVAFCCFAFYALHRIFCLDRQRSTNQPLSLNERFNRSHRDFIEIFDQESHFHRPCCIHHLFFSTISSQGPNKISICGSGLKFLPPFPHDLWQLKTLEISNTFLRQIPTGIERLKCLEHLILDNNRIEELPDALFSLKNLTVISIEKNRLSDLPDLFFRLRDLTFLNASSNRFQTLPSSISCLTKLTHMSFCQNLLEELGKTLDPLKALQVVEFSHNRIRALPSAIYSAPLLSLNFSRNRISIVSDDIGSLSQLRELDLSHNLIEELPRQLGELGSLHSCNLSFNDLYRIPPELGLLSSLNVLNLEANSRLGHIPYSLSRISTLQELNLEFTSVPLLEYQLLMSRISGGVDVPIEQQIERMVSLWAEIGGREVPRNLEFLTLSEKEMIFEWMLRLEKTIDFTQQKQQVTALGIDMLNKLENPAFKEVFFLQVQDNLSDCSDRALLNLILMFLQYSLHDAKDLTAVEHFQLILKSANTLELLGMIPSRIFKQKVVDEDTEVYLYFLHKFQSQIPLLLPFEIHMRYELAAKLKVKELGGMPEQALLEEFKSKDPLDLIFSHLSHEACEYMKKYFPNQTARIEDEIYKELSLIESLSQQLDCDTYCKKMDALKNLRTVLYRIAFLKCTATL